MHASLKKSTMSVHEMREILGIKKTESYWLVKKHCFDTVLIGGKMRVVIESFENWYANQIHYHKMNGEQPGQHLIETSYSIHDIAEMLGVTESTVHDIIHRDNLPVKDINHHWRIEKSFFQLWYENQDHYRIAEDREKDRRWEEATMSFPEMGLLFGLDRNGAYEIARNNPELTIVTIAGRKRISKKSFERWYSSQTKYKKFDEMSEDEQKKILKIHADDLVGRKLRERYMQKPDRTRVGDQQWYTTHEAAEVMAISHRAILRLVDSGMLKLKKFGKTYKVERDDLLYCIYRAEEKMKEENIHGIDC